MPNSIKTRKVLHALYCLGFQEKRQKGSHLFLEHADGRTTLVPLHKEIRKKLLVKIIKKDLKIKKQEFMKLV
jgi:predicted RNA binding protein YcfA (HicA-like mRNA interferase family)